MNFFMYWLKDVETGEEKHLVDNRFFDIGEQIELCGRFYEVIDYAVDQPIGCHELSPREE